MDEPQIELVGSTIEIDTPLADGVGNDKKSFEGQEDNGKDRPLSNSLLHKINTLRRVNYRRHEES